MYRGTRGEDAIICLIAVRRRGAYAPRTVVLKKPTVGTSRLQRVLKIAYPQNQRDNIYVTKFLNEMYIK